MTQYRHVKNTVYSLKRRYGQQITLTTITTAGTYDYTDGTQTGKVTTDRIVKRAILFPSRGLRSFNYDLSYIAANKNFTYGGFYDIYQRRLVIDELDIGTFTLDLNTTITIGTRKYQVKEIHEYEEQSARLLIIVELKGQR